jgi:pimeloyl-ACP methyl ester carboxylesterase
MSEVVAVNGLGALSFIWDGFRSALPDRPVRVLDLPGHGDRPAAADYRYAALVEDVADRTSDLEAFPLIGWSVGAAVAWLFAARHPGRVTHVVLVEPAAPHQSPFRHGATPEPVHPFTYASAAKALQAIRAIDPSASEADIALSYRRNSAGRWEPRFDPAIFPALVNDARDIGEETYFELEHVDAPTLILRGERSFLRAEQIDELAAALSNVRLETVPGAGHFLIKEKLAESARLVDEFLAGRARTE